MARRSPIGWVAALVLVLAGAAVATWALFFRTPPQEPAETRTVQAIQQWGGRVTRDEQKEGRPVIGVDLAGTSVGDTEVKQLRDLPQLQSLNLSDTPVTAAGLKELAGLKQLQTLTLAPVQVTDAVLHALREAGLLHALTGAQGKEGKRPASAAEVTTLNLSGTPVSEAGLKEIKDLKNLQTLTLAPAQVTDGVLHALREMGRLYVLAQSRGKEGKRPASSEDVTALDLSKTRVTDAGLKELKELINLQSLNLAETAVTDAGLKELEGLKNLKELTLSGTKLTAETLHGLAQAGLLHVLAQARGKDGQRPASSADVLAFDLSGTEVTPAGLQDLKTLPRLQTLKLAASQLTDAWLKELKNFPALQELTVNGSELNNETLHNLRQAGLLHRLSQAQARSGKRPTSPSSVIALDLSGADVTPIGIAELKDLDRLETLTLDAPRVNDGVLRALREIGLLHSLARARARDERRPTESSHVVALDLSKTRVTDAGLKELKELTNLQSLNLAETAVLDTGLKELKDLKNLREIVLAGPDVTDGVLHSLHEAGLLHALAQAQGKEGQRPASASDVLTLDLAHSRVSDTGLKELRDFTNLQSLNLADTKVTDAGLKELKDFKDLQTLNLADTEVTDRDLKDLKELTGLRVLNLAGTWVSNVGVKELKDLKGLKELNLTGTLVTETGRNKLTAALPWCHIP